MPEMVFLRSRYVPFRALSIVSSVMIRGMVKSDEIKMKEWRRHLRRVCKRAYLYEALQRCGHDCAEASDNCKGRDDGVPEDLSGEPLFLVIDPSFRCYLKAVAVILYKALGGKVEDNVLCISRGAGTHEGQ